MTCEAAAPRAEPVHDRPARLDDLVADLEAGAVTVGPNGTDWPGLTLYRFTAPVVPQWAQVQSLSLCVVVQGRTSLRVADVTGDCAAPDGLILHRGVRLQAEILEASPERPFLALLLQVDPATVRSVCREMLDCTTIVRPAVGHGAVSAAPLDARTVAALRRFVRATGTDADRHVLAPMYLQEVIYRLLQSEHRQGLLDGVAGENEFDRVAQIMEYVRQHLAQPLTVADLAACARLSPSAFAHRFRDVAGMSPHQYLIGARLERARELLVAREMNVSEAARAVGYPSLSHFIDAFKRRFGMTPGAYADFQLGAVPLRIDLSTAARPTDRFASPALRGSSGTARVPVRASSSGASRQRPGRASPGRWPTNP
jgi:AraC-like DNA-binding protein